MNRVTDKNITIEDLFCPEFMEKYTKSSSFLAFLMVRFEVRSLADFDAIPDEDFEKYVAESTDFECWEEMLQKAKDYFLKKHMKR